MVPWLLDKDGASTRHGGRRARLPPFLLETFAVSGLLIGAAIVAGVSVLAGPPGLATRILRASVPLLAAGILVALALRRTPWAIVPVMFSAEILLATGQGLTVERASIEGSAPSVAAGGAALACGATLMAWCGVATFSCFTARKVRAAVLAALVAVAGFTVLVFLHPIATGLALVVPARVPLGPGTPTDFDLKYDSVEFQATDGVTLRGWYVSSHNGAVVVTLHGTMADRTAVLERAAAIAAHGYGVLVMDSRGHGDSDGRGMELGWLGDRDVLGAVNFVASREDVDQNRIALLGVSLGAEEAIGAAAADHRVSAVVAEGASYRVLGDWPPHSSEGRLGRVKDWLMFETAAILSGVAEPPTLRDSVRHLDDTQRLLLIQSGSGNEIEAGRALEIVDPDAVEVWELPDAAHASAFQTDRSEWKARVIGFLDKTIGSSRRSVGLRILEPVT